VVATHIDRAHVQNHIIFNSITLDCSHKFVDFFRSGRVVRKISDLLCAEHGLSVIENPKPSRGSYADWLGGEKKPSWKEVIKSEIDELAPACKTFDELIDALRKAGYAVNDGGKYVSVAAPGQKKPTRLKSLGEGYDEAAVRMRLGVVNLKEAAKTLLFLQERGIVSYGELVKKSAAASAELSALNKRIGEIDRQQKEISELQKQIGIYSKTRAVCETCRKSGRKRSCCDEHAADIIAHRNAKKFFDSLNLGGKVPPMATLKQEWATLNSEKKLLWGDCHRLKDNTRELAVALGNTRQILGIERAGQTPEPTRETPRQTKQRGTER
jgi:hypothetical protein